MQHPGPDPLTRVLALRGAFSVAAPLEQPGWFGMGMTCLGEDVPLDPFSLLFRQV